MSELRFRAALQSLLSAGSGAAEDLGLTEEFYRRVIVSGVTIGASGAIGLGGLTISGALTVTGALNAGTLITLGGTTSAFPALKRSGAGLQVLLADESAYTAITAGTITATGNLSANTVTGTLSLSAGTTGNVAWTGRSSLRAPSDGAINLLNSAETTGVGLDVATDAVLKIRTRAQTADASLTALNATLSGTLALGGASSTSTLDVGSGNIVVRGSGASSSYSQVFRQGLSNGTSNGYDLGIATGVFVLNESGVGQVASFRSTLTAFSSPVSLASTLAVTGVTTVAAGSAAAPAIISTTGTADTGLWFPAADTVAASTAGSERLRITSAGDVGIGTTSPGQKLDVSGGHITVRNGYAYYAQNSAGSVASVPYVDTSNNQWCGSDSAAGFGSLALGSGQAMLFRVNSAQRMQISTTGLVGIGTTGAVYQLQVNTDSAGKPGAGGLWTVVSDERIKTDIVPADLDRCYEIVKAVPLKHFGYRPGVYTDEQIQDKHSLGWIAQDVQQVFEKAVSVKPFTMHTVIDGIEDYEEQDFTLDNVETTTTSIQIIDGKPVQVSKTETAENKVLLFDTVDVLDVSGAVVMNGDTPLTYQMPRMVTKTRPKVRHETIEDCLDLNSGQMIAALYGCVQALMAKVEALEAR